MTQRILHRTRTVFGIAIAALTLAITPVWAQQGRITGKVIDEDNKAGLQSARIQLVGTVLFGTTQQDGRYTIAGVTPGTYELRVFMVGYGTQRQTVTVGAGQTVTADFAMKAVPFALEEIVTTATGQQRKLELGHTIATLKVDTTIALSPVKDLTDVLQGSTPGVTVLPSSGATGSGTRIRIRGANSVSLTNEPLIFIDGARTDRGVSSFSLSVGGQAPSRLNDLNPEEIESIEIVKGPSAATLYGTEAANGVIRITTKKGKAGAPRWNSYIEQGVLQDVNVYPNNYRAFGRTLTGGVPGGAARTCLLTSAAAKVCVQDSVTTFNPLMNKVVTPIMDGYRAQYGLGVNGGTEAVRYYFSGEYEKERGIYGLPDAERARLLASRGGSTLPDNVETPNYLSKVNLRSNINANVGSNADLQVNLGYTSSVLRLPQNDNNVLGILPSGYFGQASASDTAGAGGWGFFKPGEIFSMLRQQNIERFTGSMTMNYRPYSWLSARGTLGYDINNRVDLGYDPTGQVPAFGTTNLGQRTDNRAQIKSYTADVGLNANYKLIDRWTGRTSVGAQFYKDVFWFNSSQGQRLAPGSKDIDGAALQFASQTTTDTRNFGAFIEQQVSLNDRLFVTGAVRMDDNSSFGRDFKAIFFPKASVSWLLSEEPFFPKGSVLNLLRLRAAYGQSGLQPGSLDALTYYSPTSAAVSGSSSSAVTFGGLGRTDLKPERSTEFETGLDMNFFSDRLSFELTYYKKHSQDALIARVLPPSGGVATSQLQNLGSVSNQGFEATVLAQILQQRDFSWEVNLSGSLLKNELTSLGAGIPPIVFGSQRHVPGYPLGGYWDRPISSYKDANGDGILELSEIVVGDTAVFLGNLLPTRTASLTNTFGLFRQRLRVSARLDYAGGNKQFNNTEVFRCTATGNNCRAMMDPKTPLDLQARAVVRRFSPSFSNAGFIEDADFLKLREVSVSYTAPVKWVRWMGGKSLVITAAGRNLATITNYTGIDPELNGVAQASFTTQDFLTQPPVRSFLFRFNVGF
jgi:TonB-linked SusC/RagA family outer membrane protein